MVVLSGRGNVWAAAVNDLRLFRGFRRSLRSQRNGGACRVRGVMGGGGRRWQEGTSCVPPPIFPLVPPRRTIPRSAPALSGIPLHCPRISHRRNPLAVNDLRHLRGFRRERSERRNGGVIRGRGVMGGCGQRPTALQEFPPLTAFAAEWWCHPGEGSNGRRREGMSVSHALCAAAHLPSRAAAPHHSAQRVSAERNPHPLPPH